MIGLVKYDRGPGKLELREVAAGELAPGQVRIRIEAAGLCGSDYHIMQDDILVELIEETGRIPIIYDRFIIENLKLPDLINQAIESKLRQQQEYLAYQYIIDKEREEAKRKRIEAEGIRTFQDIVSQKLSAELLSWLGIKATQELAKSPNSKIIVIGRSKDGLPLILNTSEEGNLQLKGTPPQVDLKETDNGGTDAVPPDQGK